MDTSDPADDRGVAVIGMVARLPGAPGIEAHQRHLVRGDEPDPALRDAYAFDHTYFGLSPGEALITDPQHRILLECVTHALQDAAVDPARADAVIGVYAGASTTAYAAGLRREIRRLPNADDWQIRIATGPDFLAARPAYKLGLTGPSVTVQGASATLPLAVHYAVQALLAGECDIAVAGAVTVRPLAGDGTTAGPVATGDCGVLVLRPLDAVLAAGDRVHAVVRATAVGRDDGTDRLARRARAVVGVPAGTVVPVTADTRSGAAVTDTTPGVTALLDAVLSVACGTLPGDAGDWRTPERPRRAGVDVSGPFGLRAHVLLEEPPAATRPRPEPSWQLLPVSARSQAALDRLTTDLGDLLAHTTDPLPDLAWTLQSGRTAEPHRRFTVARTTDEAATALGSGTRRKAPTGQAPDAPRPVVFTFPGQGGQHVGMARALYRTDPEFRADVNACAERTRDALGIDLRGVLDPADEAEAARSREALSTIAVGQPAVFTVEYALARALMRWGVRPTAVVGHSLGAYAAACVAGVFDFPDALALVLERGRLLQGLPSGSMAAVGLPETEVLPLLPDGVGIGAVNGPEQVAVSGPTELVERFVREFPRPNVEVRLLKIATGGHSALVEPVLDRFETYVSGLRLRAPRIPFVSESTGTWAGEEVAVPAYWRAHMRRAVRFSDALGTLAGLDRAVLLEVGPGLTLTSLARQHPALAEDHPMFQTLPHPADDTPEARVLLTALGNLWLEGTELDWAALHGGRERGRVSLPGHPFARREFVPLTSTP
ncbi:acyltransferase domain-containing protein [Streptomyces antimycoticus]|uniref:acyltransferase domain-containing protein n=1 Tax=Streptomyces antimycoticus TaxID=68175 RepID=UPI0036BF63BC